MQTEEQYIFIHDALLEAITFAQNALSTECLNFILSPNPDQNNEYWLQFESNYKVILIIYCFISNSITVSDFNYCSVILLSR